MTFLMMFPETLLSVLMILLLALSSIRHQICGIKESPEVLEFYLLHLNLTYEPLWNVDWDRKWLVSFNAGKILFFFV